MIVIGVYSSFLLVRLNMVEKKKWYFSIGWILSGSLLALMGGYQVTHYLQKAPVILNYIGVLAYMAIVLVLVKYTPLKDIKRLRKLAYIGIVSTLGAIIIINIIKIFWGKIRYWKMVELQDYSGFSPWYLPQQSASSDVFKSFPSGHTAKATMILWILCLPLAKVVQKKYYPALLVIVLSRIVLVAFSRIIDGAYFLSDVSVGLIIGTLIMYGCTHLFKLEEDLKI